MAATAADDFKITIWNVTSKRADKCVESVHVIHVLDHGVLRRMLEAHTLPIKRLVFADGGSTLYSASMDGSVLAWDWKKGKTISDFVRHDLPVSALDYSRHAGSSLVATGLVDGSITVWDMEKRVVRVHLAADAEKSVSMNMSDVTYLSMRHREIRQMQAVNASTKDALIEFGHHTGKFEPMVFHQPLTAVQHLFRVSAFLWMADFWPVVVQTEHVKSGTLLHWA